MRARGVKARSGAGRDAAVLIIVLWVAFGLVALTLYFANSMSLELRAADNRSAALEAEQAIEGAARYLSNVLGRLPERGTIPDPSTYRTDAVAVGGAMFWLIGRGERRVAVDEPFFGLVDESAKLNLNTATLEMLELLPGITPELAAAIIDWRDGDSEVTPSGAEDETYLRLRPAHRCKNADFESVDELRLVQGAYLDLVYSEDANLNGLLDGNENDGDASWPSDNRDGRLEPGLIDYLTVYTRQPVSVTNVNERSQLAPLLEGRFGADRGQEMLSRLGNDPLDSVLRFYMRSGMTLEEFRQIEGMIAVTNGAAAGLVNVNTAPEEVLACIPGIGAEHAPALVAYRQANADQADTVGWLKEVLEEQSALQAGPYVTGRSYQFTADVAAVGRHGRGYRRVKFVLDTSEDAPQVRHRQDLTHLGWGLGGRVRESILNVVRMP